MSQSQIHYLTFTHNLLRLVQLFIGDRLVYEHKENNSLKQGRVKFEKYVSISVLHFGLVSTCM